MALLGLQVLVIVALVLVPLYLQDLVALLTNRR
jgi:hypothetical protein